VHLERRAILTPPSIKLGSAIGRSVSFDLLTSKVLLFESVSWWAGSSKKDRLLDIWQGLHRCGKQDRRLDATKTLDVVVGVAT